MAVGSADHCGRPLFVGGTLWDPQLVRPCNGQTPQSLPPLCPRTRSCCRGCPGSLVSLVGVLAPGSGMRVALRNGLWRVTRGTLCAGFVVSEGLITRYAPVLRKKLVYWITVARWLGP